MDTGLDHAWAQAEDAGDAQGWLSLVYDALQGGEEADDARLTGPSGSGYALADTSAPAAGVQQLHSPYWGPQAHSPCPPPLPGHSQGQQGWASPPALDAEWEPMGERKGWRGPLPAVRLAEGRDEGLSFAAHAQEWLARPGPVPAPAADLPGSPSVPAPAFAPGSWRAGSSQPQSQPPDSSSHRVAQRATAEHSWARSAVPGHLPAGSSAPQQQQPLASSGRHAHPPTAPQPCASAYAPPPHAASTAYFGNGYGGGWFDDGTSSAPELHTPRRATDGGMYAPPSGPMQSPPLPFYPPPCPSCCCACGAGRWHQKPANAYGMHPPPYDPRAANGRWGPPPPSHQGWGAPSGHGPLSPAPSAPPAIGGPGWDPCAIYDGWSTAEDTGGPATPGRDRFNGRWVLPAARNLGRGTLPRSCSFAAVASAYPEHAPISMGLWTAAAPCAGDLAPAAACTHTPRSSAAVADPRVARCMPYARQSDPGVHRRVLAPQATGLAPQPPCAAVGPRRLPSDLQALFDRTGMPPPPEGPLPPFLHELNGKPRF
ncbi:hypothetical protein HYH03_012024 [Edaphochlamys debaryana]|uniref:Uncharacterized protein n=1 Tax=Edaphochlamys debaryana TaxID=47281 RepID=A0A835XWD2_9CHLO|nr:hypothetical protein HYH03_012024 [Edaphochlamys debaryana]|eukprot:KAG2489576.1 hypothetical protein HYH03_012024 [Edaphochlamys debaryana]